MLVLVLGRGLGLVLVLVVLVLSLLLLVLLLLLLLLLLVLVVLLVLLVLVLVLRSAAMASVISDHAKGAQEAKCRAGWSMALQALGGGSEKPCFFAGSYRISSCRETIQAK